ncbi:hypothetical protein VE03_09028 [Pseudogymnoascus sp. 23342-1-I1]|nr:hypothetical protein VE03_09028 [Pseudogymnoascus sp. 23342-1-I1]
MADPMVPPAVDASQEYTAAEGSQVNSRAEVSQMVTGADAKKRDSLSVFWRPQEIVYVIVGPEAQKFGMHKEQLCVNSAYFRAAFEGGFEEAIRREVALKESDTVAFGMFNEWLYTGKISEDLRSTNQGFGATPKPELADIPTFSQLVDAWLLADYLLAPKMQNHIIDVMEARYRRLLAPPIREFMYVYQQTQNGSPVRKSLVDMCIWRFREGGGEMYRKYIGFMPREMAADLMVALAGVVEKGQHNAYAQQAQKYYVPVNATTARS